MYCSDLWRISRLRNVPLRPASERALHSGYFCVLRSGSRTLGTTAKTKPAIQKKQHRHDEDRVFLARGWRSNWRLFKKQRVMRPRAREELLHIQTRDAFAVEGHSLQHLQSPRREQSGRPYGGVRHRQPKNEWPSPKS